MTVTGLIQWDEGPISIDQASADCELRYFLYSDDPDNDDRGTAINWLAANAPDTLYGLVLTEVDVVEQIADNNNASVQERIWAGTARYKNRGAKKPKELTSDGDSGPRISIRSGTGGTITQLYSRSMVEEIYAVDEYKFAGGTQKIERLLNVESDNSEDTGTMFIARGIDVPIGTVEIVVELVIANSSVTAGYLVNASNYAAKQVINASDWRGFPAGCVKILNVDGKQRGGSSGSTDDNPEDWEVTYTLSFQPLTTKDQLNANLPPGLEGKTFTKDKRGWDYLDVLFVDTEVAAPANANFKFIIPSARRAAIQKLYEEINFTAVLGF